jgi:2-methylcitrate dehydratase PrpD
LIEEALMTPELALADFVTRVRAADVPADVAKIVRRVLLASVGAGIAGAGEDGVAELRGLLRSRGGAPEARSLIFGDRLPAHAAAQLNGTLCRALDYCDALAPGAHIGSSTIPAALAAAELAGGCDGAELLAALVAGCETGARFNLSESMYDGFDPTGVAVVFASTAAAARILRLSRKQTLNALGLAFNRCGGSFQSNIDGTLAVRVIQGWVAQAGLECAQLAQAGVTGPEDFLTGVYGYAHLFGRGRLDAATPAASLGVEWRMSQIVFKKYPSCGATQGLTELTLGLVEELGLSPERVARIDVRLNPYCHRLVGGEFRLGNNPRVNAQFSAQYCAANAIVRKASKLPHFRPGDIADSAVQDLIGRVSCTGDPALDRRGHSAVDVTIATTDGETHARQLDVPPGFPGNELTDKDHVTRFHDCMRYAAYPLPDRQVRAFLDTVEHLETVADARALVDSLIVRPVP